MNKTILEKLEVFKEAMAACPELVYVGEKSLREKSEEVELSEGLEIAEKLKSVLLQFRKVTGLGRGVAAPQIGINKAVFVTYVGDTFQTYINPKILEKSESKNFYRELCMSSGIMSADVKRSENIKLEWADENGVRQTQDFDTFQARLLQHEYDHLLGIVNLDCCIPGSIEFVIKNPLEEKLRLE